MTATRIVTPWEPSRRATARVKHPAPIPPSCPFCGGSVGIVSNAEIYGRPFGDWPWALRCDDLSCDSYVGLHPFTAIPLGTLANRATRQARKSAKQAFNRIWRERQLSRAGAYAWLAAQMGLTAAECHFGLFDVRQCAKAQTLAERRMSAYRIGAEEAS